ncbi:MAG: PHP domain-containing protein, partial [Victivallales bacterium]|nr:PHP domain-containing protein [Victivallales bacterium]
MEIPYSNHSLANPLELYSISPRVIPADETTQITIRGRFAQSDFRKKRVIRIDSIPCDGLFSDGRLPGITMGNGYDMQRPGYEEIPFTLDESTGIISFKHKFRGEGEHFLLLCNEHGEFAAISVFALKPDLLELRPFRGDMHIHSCFSGCNRDRATPEQFVATSAQIGLDFMSISDHKQLAPSSIAMAFTNRCSCNIKAYPGEEVHLLDLHNHHLLNFGGNSDLCDFMKNSPETFAHELKPYFDAIPSDMDHYVRELLATSGYLLDKIHQDGGLSILCHPFWKPAHRFYLPTLVLDHMFSEGKFD